MHHRFGKYRIRIKLLFLCVSIVFLVLTLHTANNEIHNAGDAKLFVIDRQSDLESQVSAIDSYIDSATGQALALSINDKGETTTLLPATKDYTLYRAYLHTLNNSGESKEQRAKLTMEKSVIHYGTDTTLLSALGSMLFFLLALFL